MSRQFMIVVSGSTIMSATTSASASAQICDGILSWLCQGPASSNREPASKGTQQDKARQRLLTPQQQQRSRNGHTNTQRWRSGDSPRSSPIRTACPVPNIRNGVAA